MCVFVSGDQRLRDRGRDRRKTRQAGQGRAGIVRGQMTSKNIKIVSYLACDLYK